MAWLQFCGVLGLPSREVELAPCIRRVVKVVDIAVEDWGLRIGTGDLNLVARSMNLDRVAGDPM